MRGQYRSDPTFSRPPLPWRGHPSTLADLSHRAGRLRCRPSPPTTCRRKEKFGRAGRRGMAKPLGRTIRHRHPHDLYFFASAGGDAARAASAPRAAISMLPPSCGASCSLHPGSLGCRAHRCPGPGLASSNPPSMRSKKGGTQDFQDHLPLHLAAGARPFRASCLERFLQLFPDQLAITNRSCSASFACPGRAPLSAPYAQRADPAAVEE